MEQSRVLIIVSVESIQSLAQGQVNSLVLYTIFHIGKPTNNITYETFEYLNERKDIDWIIPIALGDSYDEFRVIATTSDYFEKIKFGDKPNYI